MGPDYWMQQQLEEERQCKLWEILQRVEHGSSNESDAQELASELGMTTFNTTRKELT